MPTLPTQYGRVVCVHSISISGEVHTGVFFRLFMSVYTMSMCVGLGTVCGENWHAAKDL